MKIAVIRFPGSNCDIDCVKAIRTLGWNADFVWHTDAVADDFDGAILPGGFSFGDALRPGVLAHFSRAVQSLKEKCEKGFPVLGICNGMQILCESSLLPGVLVQNKSGLFFCGQVSLIIRNSQKCIFTRDFKADETISLPVAHGFGCWMPSAENNFSAEQFVTLTYGDNAGVFFDNGSASQVAGLCNGMGNVFGLMPHPERAVQPWMNSLDGVKILKGFANAKRF